MLRAPRFFRTLVVGLLLAAAMPASVAGMTFCQVDRDTEPPAAGASRAIDLRVALGRLLGENAFLLMEATRVEDDADQSAFETALGENSSALMDVIAGVYGDDAGQRFGDIWDRHVELLLDYGTAAHEDDTDALRVARDGLTAHVGELGRLLIELNPNLDAAPEAQALQAQIDQITAFAEGDYADAYASRQMAFSHMFELGDHLALEIVLQHPDEFADGAIAFSPRSDLQLALDHLLSDHMVLAAEAMRAGLRETPEFEAATASLDENTQDLAKAIAGVYGEDAGAQFRDVWHEHTSAYVSFVDALVRGDGPQRQESLARLHGYHDRIAQFLASANPMLDGPAVSDLIRRHVQALITQAEATAADDPDRAVTATRDGYAGTFEVGAALSDAIARQFPDRFRDLTELPLTDGAGPAEPPTNNVSLPMVAALLLTTSVWLVLTAHRRAQAHVRRAVRR
jgi:hypothetical protein